MISQKLSPEVSVQALNHAQLKKPMLRAESSKLQGVGEEEL